MKTLSGKEFRKLFNRYETGFYLSEFEYLNDSLPFALTFILSSIA